MKPYVAIPATLALVYRAWSRKSLTTTGIVAAAITALVHAQHPWSTPFTLLVIFYLGGTTATKVRAYGLLDYCRLVERCRADALTSPNRAGQT